MAVYRVQAPDGKILHLEGPDGAAPDEIMAQARKLYTPKADPRESAKMALEGEGMLGKAVINLGAGADTAWQGLKQLVGAGEGDAALRQGREMKQALADETPGGGALQFVGEVAPTLAIPGAGFVRGGQALIKGGAMAGARLGTGAAMTDAAIGGALGGALSPVTSDESRTMNVVAGGVGGAALPAVFALGRTLRQMMTRGGAEAKAAQELIQRVGGEQEAEAVLAKLRSNTPHPVVKDVPMTVAEVTQNPALARAERNAQSRFAEDWAPMRAEQAQERYGALRAATAGADNLDAAKATRETASKPLRDDALKAAEGGKVNPVAIAVDALDKGGSGSNPAVQRIVSYVKGEVADGMLPERLYTVRKVLTQKLNGKMQIGDDLGAATKQARAETMQLVSSIDDALDKASGGKWTPYLKEYASKSGEVNSAEAEAMIRKVFDREGAPMLAGVPEVTGHRLAGAIEKHGANSYGEKLTPDARDALRALQDNVAQSEGLQKLLKLTGTSGGGSNTAMDLTGLAAEAASNKLAAVTPIIGKLIERSDKMTQRAMSDALRNPDAFIAGVSKKLAQNRPLTRTEESVMTLLKTAGSGSALALVPEQ